jgi:glycyl-tRNA synthetase beta chain
MLTLLLEVGCEELPASTCRSVTRELPKLCEEHLKTTIEELYVGPRRIALLASVPESVEAGPVTGPPAKIAFDENGEPTKAALGFARKVDVEVDQLELVDGVLTFQPGPQPIAELVGDAVPALIKGLSMPKPMVWDEHRLPFARPIRWLCVMLDDRVVPVELAGLTAASTTFGHRFDAGELDVPSAGEYASALRAARVEPDADERRRQIVEGLDALGGWSDPGGVLDEVVHLVEEVTVLTGAYDERYLRLPARVTTTAMQSHQRYFPLESARFAFVANGGDPDIVRRGNEQVLEGRLEDAAFTYDRDLARGLDELAGSLGSIIFVARAGSFADKTARLEALVGQLGGEGDALVAARLSKGDQAAELVREFPDLEGYIGGEYARSAGYPEVVATAIADQFLPDASEGPLPGTPEGRLLAAADKLDSLAVAFGLGERPTGSRDPFGLRRAASGLCRLAIEAGLEIEIGTLASSAHGLLAAQGAELSESEEEASGAIEDFVLERLETLLSVPVEFVRAARGSALTEVGAIAALAQALAGLDKARLERLHTIYTRAARIVDKADDDQSGGVRPELFEHDAERDVLEALERVEQELREAATPEAAFASAEALAEPLERFFEDVLVMAEDPAVRVNRLEVLRRLREAVSSRLGHLAEIGM